MTTRPGGFGRQGFGPFGFGAGGPLTVVRAVAVAGQVVRVVFNEEPVHRSAAGAVDALNPSNYVLSVPGANATASVPVGVDPTMIVGPAYIVGNGGATDERGFDVHTDRELIAGVVYQIQARNIQSAAGGLLGSPDSATFGGVTKLLETRLPTRNQDLVDIANPPSLGHFVVDDSGDVAPEDPDAGTRKRVSRRITTPLNSYRFLKDYGGRLRLKATGSVSDLAAARADWLRQIRREPDVGQATLSVTIVPATGLTKVSAQAKTTRGTFVDVRSTVSMIGSR